MKMDEATLLQLGPLAALVVLCRDPHMGRPCACPQSAFTGGGAHQDGCLYAAIALAVEELNEALDLGEIPETDHLFDHEGFCHTPTCPLVRRHAIAHQVAEV